MELSPFSHHIVISDNITLGMGQKDAAVALFVDIVISYVIIFNSILLRGIECYSIGVVVYIIECDGIIPRVIQANAIQAAANCIIFYNIIAGEDIDSSPACGSYFESRNHRTIGSKGYSAAHGPRIQQRDGLCSPG